MTQPTILLAIFISLIGSTFTSYGAALKVNTEHDEKMAFFYDSEIAPELLGIAHSLNALYLEKFIQQRKIIGDLKRVLHLRSNTGESVLHCAILSARAGHIERLEDFVITLITEDEDILNVVHPVTKATALDLAQARFQKLQDTPGFEIHREKNFLLFLNQQGAISGTEALSLQEHKHAIAEPLLLEQNKKTNQKKSACIIL